MSSVIIMQGNSLESFYDQTMDFLHAKYHSHSPDYPDFNFDDGMVSEMGYYECMADDIDEKKSYGRGVPLGKLVI